MSGGVLYLDLLNISYSSREVLLPRRASWSLFFCHFASVLVLSVEIVEMRRQMRISAVSRISAVPHKAFISQLRASPRIGTRDLSHKHVAHEALTALCYRPSQDSDRHFSVYASPFFFSEHSGCLEIKGCSGEHYPFPLISHSFVLLYL